jgi:transposase
MLYKQTAIHVITPRCRHGRHPAAEVHLLIPRLWKQHFADNPLRSDLHGRAP